MRTLNLQQLLLICQLLPLLLGFFPFDYKTYIHIRRLINRLCIV